MKILRDSNRVDKTKFGAYGGGGNNRTVQIEEFFKKHFEDVVIADIDFNQPTSKSRRWSSLYQLIRNGFQVKKSKWLLGWTAHHYQCYLDKLRSDNYDLLLLEEPPSYLAYHAAHECNVPVVVFAHNIETLMPAYTEDFFTKGPKIAALARELDYMVKAPLVVCISREEKWLLDNLGANTVYWPYFPTHAQQVTVERLSGARSQNSAENYYTVVSTMQNQGTKEALFELVEWMKESDHNFKIAGYGTEELRDKIGAYPNIVVLGGCTNEVLFETLKYTKAAIIHQNKGAGAITRIPEYLSSGVPLLVNDHAARSAREFEGVYTYSGFSEFSELLGRTFKNPTFSTRQDLFDQALVQKLKEVLGE